MSELTERALKSIVTLDRHSSGGVNSRSYSFQTQADAPFRETRCMLTDAASNERYVASVHDRDSHH